MENVLISAAYGYSEGVLEPFLFSFRRYSRDPILLVVDAGTRISEEFVNKYGVELVADDDSSGMAALKRYSAKLKSVKLLPSSVKRIMLSDSRDVFFQGNPFTFSSLARLNFALEPESIGNCVVNAGWIRDLYGPAKLEDLSTLPISCSGTTLGDRASVESYLERMVDELARLTAGEIELPHGGDQGIHNFLIHSGAFSGAVLHPNNSGLVSTLHHQQSFVFDRLGRLLSEDGSPSLIVHQYDRLAPYFKGAFYTSCYGVQANRG